MTFLALRMRQPTQPLPFLRGFSMLWTRQSRVGPCITLALSAWCILITNSTQGQERRASIQPWMNKFCIECHQGDDAKGQLDLLAALQGEASEHYQTWEAAFERIQSREMPPDDSAQPTEKERQAFVEWYQKELVDSVEAKPSTLRPRRLCAAEYRNTIRSLFGFDLEVTVIEAEQTVAETSLILKLLPTDPPGQSGFRNDTHQTPLTTLLWEQYSYLADTAITELFSAKRRPELERMVGPVNEAGLTAQQAAQLIRLFARRAFRRPVDDSALQDLTSFTDVGVPGSEKVSPKDIQQQTQAAIKRICMSPTFLYRGLLAELDATETDTDYARVDAYEYAERLSYFIWADMPDEVLYAAAQSGELSTAEQIRAQVNRMLDSPRSQTLSTDFAYQWLTLSEVEKNNVEVPQAEALRSQPRDFINYLFMEDRPLIELIDSRIAFANPFTRGYYGNDSRQMSRYQKAAGIEQEIVPNQKIRLTETEERGGLLTMPGILAMNEGPIQRGTWILERILGEDLPEPPPNVGQVPPPPQGQTVSFRERFEQHRNQETCAICHDKIDPLGFALERYQGAKYSNDSSIDASGQLPTGEKFDDYVGLKQILVTTQKKAVIRNIVRQTLAYALCRKLELHDRPTVEQLTEHLHETNGTYRDLVFEIVMCLPFQTAMLPTQTTEDEVEGS
jgi:hypothetical protein